MSEREYCPGCGEAFDHDAVHCPSCGADHLERDRIGDLRGTSEKGHGAGEGWLSTIPVLLPFVAVRQERIEQAQRELVSYKAQFDDAGADDAKMVHCRACGEQIPSEASTCDACGNENVIATLDAIDYDVHDPADHDAWVSSDRWWIGVAAGPLLGVTAFVASQGVNAGVGFWGAVFLGGLLSVTCLYLDRNYLSANAPWKPSMWWALAFLWPPVNFVGPYVYLYRRMRILGLGAHR